MNDIDMDSIKKYLNGALSAREPEFRQFMEIKTISSLIDRPIIVFPDGHIFLETKSKYYEKAVEFVVAISEPVTRPEYVHEYQITPFSLFAAVSIGLTSENIIYYLSQLSKTDLDKVLIQQIKAIVKSVGKLKLVLKGNRFFIESSRVDLLNNILKNPIFNKAKKKPKETDNVDESSTFLLPDDDEFSTIIAGIGDVSEFDSQARFNKNFGNSTLKNIEQSKTLRFEISQDKIEEIKLEAIKLNIPLSDEYSFHTDKELPNLPIDLKITTYIRPYQEKSLSKMFSGDRSRSGIIVLPCGAGKTLVGIVAACTIKKSTIVLCNANVPVNQWKDQFLKWTDIDKRLIVTFTSKNKQDLPSTPCILITTYSILATGNKKAERTEEILSQIRNRDWGLMILDEVHEAVAKTFRTVMTNVRAHTKLGLSATLVREDDKIADLRHLIGPKLYEANWTELAREGFLANVKCYDIRRRMSGIFYKEYLNAKSPPFKKILATLNPFKLNTLQKLLKFHETKKDKILVFCDNIWALEYLAKKLHHFVLHGQVSDDERQKIFQRFRMESYQSEAISVLFISKIGDKAIDLPSANVLIQISSHFGSRMQEAQRLGRILRPKKRAENSEYNATFYSLISEDTSDMYFSSKRQTFLIDQGYSYEILGDGEELINECDIIRFDDIDTQLSIINDCKNAGDEIQGDEKDENEIK